MLTENQIYKKITIVIVLYNSTDLVLECFKSIKNFRIIIVDNGKNEKILKKIENDFNIEKIIISKKNVGFGKGVNSAIDYIQTDFFLMLNPDTTIDKESIIDLYKTSIEYNPVASAPWVEDDKSCYGLLPENGKGIKRSNTEIKSAELLNNKKPDGNCCVEVHKCCALLINKKKFLSVKMFNPEYFLFWEEIDLCRKFRNNKFSLVLNPECNMIHHEGNSVNDNIATYCIKTFNHEYSPLIYFNVSKLNLNIYWKIIKYFCRAISYLLILNFKNSLKNFLKLLATINYILFK